eukprot:TRINITY_DN2351_c0_g1_i2.p1 TRINITY_DN2351_c0_g1~~TRINITY_DN2351_c0_g1_i2.p1  ORF type:complete len:201 (+),score=35.65 TRINITY_DN2351_c0_g1_i2:389-991(+)
MYYENAENSRVDVLDDLIVVSTLRPHDKLPFSQALARSAKLNALQNQFRGFIDLVGKAPEYLLKNKFPPQLNNLDDVYVKISVFLKWKKLVHVNLSELEPSEAFWDAPRQDYLYKQLESHLDLNYRVSIVNKKLETSLSHLYIIRDKLSEIKMHRANKMIILFIALSVIFTGLEKTFMWKHFTWEDFFESCKNKFISFFS